MLISNNDKNKQNLKRSKSEKKDFRRQNMKRLLALILAILMVGGGVVSIILSFSYGIYAADYGNYYSSDDKVSVGLMYGTNVTIGFETSTTNGYTIGTQYMSGNKEFVPIWETDENVVSVVCDANLGKTNMSYYLTSSYNDVKIGGYSIELGTVYTDKYSFASALSNVNRALYSSGYEAFPVFENGSMKIRIGNYASVEDAQNAAAYINSILPNEYISVSYPSSNGVMLINPYTDTIICKYICGSGESMGLAARSTEGREAYIKTPAANIYTGVFAYCRNDYKNENGTKADGVKLVNVVPLEEYISGVLPYEINNSWPIEVQKAFAITVRSYTIANMGRHSSFDLCNTQHCQVYKGVGYVNDTVSEAVNSTAGLVMKYGNKIVSAYYSSSAGGVTVSAHEAWGGDPEPYMVARETPWEDYMNYANGFWIVEVSPDELLDYLKNTKGYTELNGSIADISIQQLAQNSTYVYSLKITDTYGNSIVLKKTDTIRSTLAKYLNSANFVVGKGSVQYTESVNLDHTYENNYNNGSGVTSEDKDFGYISLNDYSVQSEYGKSDSQYINGYITIITEDGVDTYLRSDAFVITKENAASFLDDDELEGIDVDNNANSSEENWQTEVIDDNISGNIETFTKVAYASDPSNFIFVGKGWGHGVGMSQYGARELALMGYDYKYILDAYFTNITITNYR